MLHIKCCNKKLQNHVYELAIKEGTHNILKTKCLPSLIPLGSGRGDLQNITNNNNINHHKVESQSTINHVSELNEVNRMCPIIDCL